MKIQSDCPACPGKLKHDFTKTEKQNKTTNKDHKLYFWGHCEKENLSFYLDPICFD